MTDYPYKRPSPPPQEVWEARYKELQAKARTAADDLEDAELDYQHYSKLLSAGIVGIVLTLASIGLASVAGLAHLEPLVIGAVFLAIAAAAGSITAFYWAFSTGGYSNRRHNYPEVKLIRLQAKREVRNVQQAIEDHMLNRPTGS